MFDNSRHTGQVHIGLSTVISYVNVCNGRVIKGTFRLVCNEKLSLHRDTIGLSSARSFFPTNDDVREQELMNLKGRVPHQKSFLWFLLCWMCVSCWDQWYRLIFLETSKQAVFLCLWAGAECSPLARAIYQAYIIPTRLALLYSFVGQCDLCLSTVFDSPRRILLLIIGRDRAVGARASSLRQPTRVDPSMVFAAALYFANWRYEMRQTLLWSRATSWWKV